MWDFNMQTRTWSEINLADRRSDGHRENFVPQPRSGHSAVVHGQKMYIFGGIFELTKELNDMVIFDMATRRFQATEV
jgi:N-acetylneuraminic acid mutarotase